MTYEDNDNPTSSTGPAGIDLEPVAVWFVDR